MNLRLNLKCLQEIGAMFLCVLMFLPAFLAYKDFKSGDASIYFVFIKNFWQLPFGFQPGTISFGATSPMHVVLMSVFYLIFKSAWLISCKFFNFLLLPVGCYLLNKSLKGGFLTLLVIASCTLLFTPLISATCELYETGLAFFCISLLVFLLSINKHQTAVLVSGSLYLIRPELLLVTFGIISYLFLIDKSHRSWRFLFLVLLSWLPSVIYHFYIFTHTGEIIPSSVIARSICAEYATQNWLSKFSNSIKAMDQTYQSLVVLGLAILIIKFSINKAAKYWPELIVILPITILFCIKPPGYYIPRYLIPILPGIILALAMLFVDIKSAAQQLLKTILNSILARNLSAVFSFFLAVFLTGFAQAKIHEVTQQSERYDYETLLLKDLAMTLNPIIESDSKILIYEIQAQFYLHAFCYSLDGIVGGHLLPFLSKKESIENFLKKEKIQYIVSMNSFNYRPEFKNTLLHFLFNHDESSTVHDIFYSEDLKFTKILTNKIFADPALYFEYQNPAYNNGNTIRLYNEKNPLWHGHHPMWNSVYKIEVVNNQ